MARHRMDHENAWTVVLIRTCSTCGKGYFLATEDCTVRRRNGSTIQLTKGQLLEAGAAYDCEPASWEPECSSEYAKLRAYVIRKMIGRSAPRKSMLALLRKAVSEAVQIERPKGDGFETVGPFPEKAKALEGDAEMLEEMAASAHQDAQDQLLGAEPHRG